MTALKEYARLETGGLWHPEAGEARAVGVTLGDATLVLLDEAGMALAHWSLPAIVRLNPGDLPALYAPDDAGTETLSIEDETMTAAVERVRRSVAQRRGGTGRVRGGVVPALALLAAVAALLWIPGALRREALSVMPASRRSEVGATLLGHVQRDLGPACRDPLGVDALERLRARVLGEGRPGQAVVLQRGPDAPLLLPGGIVVLSRAMVEAATEPADVAGHILAAGAGEAEPLLALLDSMGTWGVTRLLATGDIGDESLARFARTRLELPASSPSPDDLSPIFARAGVPMGPYAPGEDLGDGAGLETSQAGSPPLIADGDWVSLQGICSG